MNSVNLIGRLSNSPQLRITTSGKKICRFSIAVTRRFKNSVGDYETDFINCVAFNKTAELINEYVQKGDLVGVDGRIQTGSYTAGDGSKRYTTDVVAENIYFLKNKEKPAHEQVSEQVEKQTDIFADFGENVEIDDNFLE